MLLEKYIKLSDESIKLEEHVRILCSNLTFNFKQQSYLKLWYMLECMGSP